MLFRSNDTKGLLLCLSGSVADDATPTFLFRAAKESTVVVRDGINSVFNGLFPISTRCSNRQNQIRCW